MHGPLHGVTAEQGARALATFFEDVAPRAYADLVESGVLAGAPNAKAEYEWQAAALHACVRGAVAVDLDATLTADLIDAFHERVLASGQWGAAHELQTRRAHIAARYGEYDGLARTLGTAGGDRVPGAIASACATHIGAEDSGALRDTLAPLLEALAEGASQAVTETDEPEVAMPPREPLRVVTARLDAAGIEWAVGGSGLLAALGLVEHVNDWDVQVECDPEPLKFLFATLPHEFHGHGGCHADWKLAFEAQRTELIPRFAFFAPAGVVRIRLHVTRHWLGLPIASPEGWAVAYWLMGRDDEPEQRARRAARAELLFTWLDQAGADAARLDELLAEPLPAELAQRLQRLRRA